MRREKRITGNREKQKRKMIETSRRKCMRDGVYCAMRAKKSANQKKTNSKKKEAKRSHTHKQLNEFLGEHI